MYPTVLILHSIFRWLVVGVGFVAVVRGLRAGARASWRAGDARLAVAFTTLLDLQFLLGLLLYFVFSPLTTTGVQRLDLVMQNRVMRFWMIEHPVLMIAALVVAHVGRARIRRAPDAARARHAAALFFGLAIILILAGIPWPFLSYGRPLLW